MGLMRTWKELAQWALGVQKASNLTWVVSEFLQVLSEVRDRLREEGKPYGPAAVRAHPICILYADKIAQLTDIQHKGCEHDCYNGPEMTVAIAHQWAQKEIEK